MRNDEEACCGLCAAFVEHGVAAPNLEFNRGAKMRLCILLLTQCAALETALLAAGVVERTGMVSTAPV